MIARYKESKKLNSFGTIREKKAHIQAEMWSSNKELQDGLLLSDLNKEFMGTEKTFDENLQLHVVSEHKWDKAYWLNRARGTNDGAEIKTFLRDNIGLRCPSQLSSDSSIFRTCVLFPDDEKNGDKEEMHKAVVTYVDGILNSVKQGLYF